jgi:hypothetical protein
VGTKVLHKLNAQTLLLPKLEMTCRVCQGTVFDQLQQKAIMTAPQKLFLQINYPIQPKEEEE